MAEDYFYCYGSKDTSRTVLFLLFLCVLILHILLVQELIKCFGI